MAAYFGSRSLLPRSEAGPAYYEDRAHIRDEQATPRSRRTQPVDPREYYHQAPTLDYVPRSYNPYPIPSSLSRERTAGIRPPEPYLRHNESLAATDLEGEQQQRRIELLRQNARAECDALVAHRRQTIPSLTEGATDVGRPWEWLRTEAEAEYRCIRIARQNLSSHSSRATSMRITRQQVGGYHCCPHIAALTTFQRSDALFLHEEKGKRFNELAACEAFRYHNVDYPSGVFGLRECDLHNLFKSEAVKYVESHLNKCGDAGVTQTTFITGRGNHSEDGPILRDAMFSMLSARQGLRVHIDEGNVGRLAVDLTTGEMASKF